MPYGNLVKQRVQRFACVEDMDKHECTIEEREEYEHHILAGTVVFAGVDYKAILTEAEKEADVVMSMAVRAEQGQVVQTGDAWFVEPR